MHRNVAIFFVLSPFLYTQTEGLNDLKEMSLENLLDLKVESFSKREEKKEHVAGPIYVLTADEILNSGVTNLPEALRLLPGIEVARAGAHSWAISIRGFNGTSANKLLVLIDGRSVYTPLFSGVFWDMQAVLVEDIKQIELIAGPGGTIWGANAFNGVINIVTKSSLETQGGYLRGTGSGEEITLGIRWGGKKGDHSFRISGDFLNMDASQTSTGENEDEWQRTNLTFRLDVADDLLSVTANTFKGTIGERTIGVDAQLGTSEQNVDGKIKGHNLVANLKFPKLEVGDLKAFFWADYTQRDIPNYYSEKRVTADLGLQYHLEKGAQAFTLGGGYRWTEDEVDNSFVINFVPESRKNDLWSVFVQDEIRFGRQKITIGSKFERNDYTGWEVLPSVRWLFLEKENLPIWGAISRAVRIPSRLDSDLIIRSPLPAIEENGPLVIVYEGRKDVDIEKLTAIDFGLRYFHDAKFSLDFNVFYHDYSNLQTVEPQPPRDEAWQGVSYTAIPFRLENLMEGRGYGATLQGNWQLFPWLKLQASYAYMDLDLELLPLSRSESTLNAAENLPQNRAAISLRFQQGGWSAFVHGRHVDELGQQEIPSYQSIDLHAQKILQGLKLGLSVENVANSSFREFNQTISDRKAVGYVSWQF